MPGLTTIIILLCFFPPDLDYILWNTSWSHETDHNPLSHLQLAERNKPESELKSNLIFKILCLSFQLLMVMKMYCDFIWFYGVLINMWVSGDKINMRREWNYCLSIMNDGDILRNIFFKDGLLSFPPYQSPCKFIILKF